VIANSRGPESLRELIEKRGPSARAATSDVPELPDLVSGEKTEHGLHQQQLPLSRMVKAFTHIQAPGSSIGQAIRRPDGLAQTA
jgi:hypothetical protein